MNISQHCFGITSQHTRFLHSADFISSSNDFELYFWTFSLQPAEGYNSLNHDLFPCDVNKPTMRLHLIFLLRLVRYHWKSITQWHHKFNVGGVVPKLERQQTRKKKSKKMEKKTILLYTNHVFKRIFFFFTVSIAF